MERLPITPNKVFAVEYAGHIYIQDEDDYDGKDMLDFDVVGKEQAEANAKLYCDAHNTYNKVGLLPSEMSNMIDEMLDFYRTNFVGKDRTSMPFKIREHLEEYEKHLNS